MDDGSRLFLFTLLFLVFLFAGGFFSLAQASFSALGEARLRKLCDDGVKKALRVQRAYRDPARFHAAMEFAFLCCVILAALCAFAGYEPGLTAGLTAAFGGPGAHTAARILSFLIIALLDLFLTAVVSRIVPRHLGAGKPERYAFFCAPGARAAMILLCPGVFLAEKLSAGLAKLFGSDPARQAPEVTEEEIRMMVDEGSEIGVIESSQMEMINNVFEFDDTTASDVMTHRTNVTAVPRGTKITDVVALAVEEGFSRIPVYEEDIDDVVGAVYVKDLLPLINKESVGDTTVDSFIRPVLYVPDSAKLPELFRLLSAKKAHLAIVVDEYGGTSGLLTMEDLVEEIVGNIQDEYDTEEDAITKIDETTFTLDGGVELEELEKALGVPFEKTDDYDTVGGLIIHRLGRIPSPSEEICVTIDGVEFTVLLVEDRRIARIRAVKLPPAEEAADDPGEET